MREIVVLCCLAAGAATVDWRAALDLDETPYVQRARSAGWRADLAAALDFDLASLGYTTRVETEVTRFQKLPNVMAPRFVKLALLRIDVLSGFDHVVW